MILTFKYRSGTDNHASHNYRNVTCSQELFYRYRLKLKIVRPSNLKKRKNTYRVFILVINLEVCWLRYQNKNAKFITKKNQTLQHCGIYGLFICYYKKLF